MISSVDILNKEGRIFTKNNIDIYETELKSRTRPTMCFLVVAFFSHGSNTVETSHF